MFFVLLDRFFKLKENNTDIKTEIIAGFTTFITMAYTIILNPEILSSTGMERSSVMTATILVSIIGTLVMALLAKLPLALAPGLGLDAFFAYTICAAMGYKWQVALTVVFFEGVIFILMTLCNIREAFLKAIPENMKKAIPVGIGLFITLIGLYNAGIVTRGTGTIMAMGNIFDKGPLLSLIGIIVIISFLHFKLNGALLLGVLLTAVIGIPMGVTTIPDNFNPVSMPNSMSATFFKLDFSWLDKKEDIISFLFLLFTMLLINIFDTLGILIGVVKKTNLFDKDGNIPHVKKAFLADAVATTCAGLFGTSVVTAYVESAAGVIAGGRTGLTALVTAIMFGLTLFFTPIFLLVPMAAVAPAMVVVGLFMMAEVKDVDFENHIEAMPAFLTIVMMPFSYSIADGIIFGILAYIFGNAFTGKIKRIHPITLVIGVLFMAKLLFLK